jgi:hypothetical protein
MKIICKCMYINYLKFCRMSIFLQFCEYSPFCVAIIIDKKTNFRPNLFGLLVYKFGKILCFIIVSHTSSLLNYL